MSKYNRVAEDKQQMQQFVDETDEKIAELEAKPSGTKWYKHEIAISVDHSEGVMNDRIQIIIVSLVSTQYELRHIRNIRCGYQQDVSHFPTLTHSDKLVDPDTSVTFGAYPNITVYPLTAGTYTPYNYFIVADDHYGGTYIDIRNADSITNGVVTKGSSIKTIDKSKLLSITDYVTELK